VWKQIRNPQAALATLLERPVVFADQANPVEKGRGPFLVLQRLTVKLREVRLVIKRINVAQTAHQNHMHHALGGGGEMTDRLWGRL